GHREGLVEPAAGDGLGVTEVQVAVGNQEQLGVQVPGDRHRGPRDGAVEAELHEDEQDGDADAGDRHRRPDLVAGEAAPGEGDSPRPAAQPARDRRRDQRVRAPSSWMRTWPSRLVNPDAARLSSSRTRTWITRLFSGAVGSSPKTSLR